VSPGGPVGVSLTPPPGPCYEDEDDDEIYEDEDDLDDMDDEPECYHELHAIPLLDPVLDQQVVKEKV
jgi:hypothetical protein